MSKIRRSLLLLAVTASVASADAVPVVVILPGSNRPDIERALELELEAAGLRIIPEGTDAQSRARLVIRPSGVGQLVIRFVDRGEERSTRVGRAYDVVDARELAAAAVSLVEAPPTLPEPHSAPDQLSPEAAPVEETDPAPAPQPYSGESEDPVQPEETPLRGPHSRHALTLTAGAVSVGTHFEDFGATIGAQLDVGGWLRMDMGAPQLLARASIRVRGAYLWRTGRFVGFINAPVLNASLLLGPVEIRASGAPLLMIADRVGAGISASLGLWTHLPWRAQVGLLYSGDAAWTFGQGDALSASSLELGLRVAL